MCIKKLSLNNDYFVVGINEGNWIAFESFSACSLVCWARNARVNSYREWEWVCAYINDAYVFFVEKQHRGSECVSATTVYRCHIVVVWHLQQTTLVVRGIVGTLEGSCKTV